MDVSGRSEDTYIRILKDTPVRSASLTVLEFSWFRLAICLVGYWFKVCQKGESNHLILVSAYVRFTLASILSASMDVSLIGAVLKRQVQLFKFTDL
jgi:hypothetical protein